MSNLTNNTQNLQRVLESLQGKAAGGGGGGGGIIEVLQLPTENIDNRYLYRVTKADLYLNNEKQGNSYVVAELPATGEPVTMDGASVNASYYNDTDNTLYGYVPDWLGSLLGVPAGWYAAEMLINAFGIAYGGVVTNIAEANESDTIYLVLTNPLYSYEDGNWYEVATTGATLTLKTRVVRSWEEAISFCFDHKVYEMVVEILRFFFEEGGSSADTIVCRNLSLTESKSMLSFSCNVTGFATEAYELDINTGYETGESPSVWVGYWRYWDGIQKTVKYTRITEIDTSDVSQVTIYYFE